MTKVKSGAILLAVGVLMNIVGRFVPKSDDTAFAGLFAFWMIASVVVGLFGLFRLILGGIKKDPA